MQLFRFGLGVKLSNVDVSEHAVAKRHDIFHRNWYGRNTHLLSGLEHKPREPAEAVQAFAETVFGLITVQQLAAQIIGKIGASAIRD